MVAGPRFAAVEEYNSRLEDVGYWQPTVAEILQRHGLASGEGELAAGTGGTYPTFLAGDVVVKLFGFVPTWRESFTAERTAHALLSRDTAIAAPRLLGAGDFSANGGAAWAYLISTRVPGVSWWDAELAPEERIAVAADLGRQLGRVHALPAAGAATQAAWSGLDIAAGAARSSLPAHLVGQVDAYLERLEPFDCVFTHGDMFARHVFVENGRLSGIIDWGDALVSDRHYELAKLHLDTFRADKGLLRVFLEASAWPVGEGFARQALGLALYRQAIGLAQHLANDTFYLLPELLELEKIGTLDELAGELFAI